MRNPALSVNKVPYAASAGREIRQILDRGLDRFPAFTDSVLASLSGSPLSEPPQELLLSTRREICGLSGRAINDWSPGLCTQVLSTYIELSGDPDNCLPDWLNEGAPLGIKREVPRRGIFPPVPDQQVDSGYLSKLVLGPTGWTNYRSAEDEPELTCSLLDDMVDKQWADKFSTWPQVERALGTEEIVMNRLALISKMKPDGSMKHRLVWDLRRSGVNLAILQGERVVLPRLLDLVRDVQAIAGGSNPTFLMGTDVTEAFHQVPLHPSEQAYTVASVAGVFYVFRVLVFGSGSAPTVWGRYGAFLGRSTAAILGRDPVRLQVYVDDPVYAATGRPPEAARFLAVALLWARVAGFPLSWKKTECGQSLRWIGAQVTVEADAIMISIPEDKGQELVTATRSLLGSNVCGARKLRSFAGLVSFYAGLIPFLRPFLSGIWAVLPHHGCDTTYKSRWIHTKRIRTSLLWLHAFFSSLTGNLVRRYPFVGRSVHRYTIVTDASPWGIGGVLYLKSAAVAYFSDKLHLCDLNRFRARIGESAFTTVWESLAILVALRLWRPLFTYVDAVGVRSDSHGSLSALASLSTSSASLSLIVCEIALDSALSDCALSNLTAHPWSV